MQACYLPELLLNHIQAIQHALQTISAHAIAKRMLPGQLVSHALLPLLPALPNAATQTCDFCYHDETSPHGAYVASLDIDADNGKKYACRACKDIIYPSLQQNHVGLLCSHVSQHACIQQARHYFACSNIDASSTQYQLYQARYQKTFGGGQAGFYQAFQISNAQSKNITPMVLPPPDGTHPWRLADMTGVIYQTLFDHAMVQNSFFDANAWRQTCLHAWSGLRLMPIAGFVF